MTVPVRFEISYHQCLDYLGQLHAELGEYCSQPEALINFYRIMLLTRLFDQKAIGLQRTGRLGTYASSLGQEAIGAALGAAMSDQDVLLPTYRDYAAQFSRGVSLCEILLYWGGDERGMNFQVPREDFPICVPIASQTCHAVGVAYAMKLRQQARVSVCVIGDGATSKGDFYEAINAAAAWQLPLVFIINNNQWAISLPRNKQSLAQTLAQKAIAAGMPGEQVDGNDVIACYQRIDRAITLARDGGGPQLVEALSYRLSDHTTADDAGRYRSEEELKQQWQYEPIARLKKFLLEKHWVSESRLSEIQQQCEHRVEEQVQAYLDTPAQAAQSMFDYLYAELPDALRAQRHQVMAKGGGDG